jgi:putative transposase
VELVERKEAAHWLWEHFLVSQRRICELMKVSESSQRYVSRKNDEALRVKLVEAAREKPRCGYRRLQFVLKEKGMDVNHKKVYRVYREAGLMIRRRRRKRLLRAGFVRPLVTGANQEWALDFVHDAAESGRKISRAERHRRVHAGVYARADSENLVVSHVSRA